MKNLIPLLGVGAAAALLLAFSGKSSSPSSQIIEAKAGETWRLTMKASGVKIDPARIEIMKKGLGAFDHQLLESSISADGSEATLIVKLGANEKFPVGVPFSMGGASVVYTSATKVEPTGVQVGNPAAAYCLSLGGRLETEETPLGQRGICILPDGSRHDQWDLYRKSLKTT